MVLVWILVPLVILIVVLSINAFRNRRPSSLEAGMRDFRRGLEALDPANDPLRRGRSDDRGGSGTTSSVDPRNVDPRNVDPRNVDPRNVDPRNDDFRRRR
jgi:hypothetical protein